MKNKTEKLVELYNKASKHSNYQVLASQFDSLGLNNFLVTKSRYERERLDFICKHIDFNDKTVLDIGANTGFFSFEINKRGARAITSYEGNSSHSDFLKEASKVLDINIKIENAYYKFDNQDTEKYDIVLLLNVIHHLGDDFGEKKITLDKAKAEMAKIINDFAFRAEYLVLQFGFCWKGNILHPMFEGGTKSEMISFLEEQINNWDILQIGIAVENNGITKYKTVDSANISRDDSLGEFRNRPLFILKKK